MWLNFGIGASTSVKTSIRFRQLLVGRAEVDNESTHLLHKLYIENGFAHLKGGLKLF